jgi:hypothetical protein
VWLHIPPFQTFARLPASGRITAIASMNPHRKMLRPAFADGIRGRAGWIDTNPAINICFLIAV